MSKKMSFLRIFQKIALFACVFCAFFISPVFATLPAGYTELEYIESTGTQYIDTGIPYFADFEVGIKLRSNVANKALGNAIDNCMERLTEYRPYWRFASNGVGVYESSNIPITEYHVMSWKNDAIYADGVKLTGFTKSKGSANMTLFGAGSTRRYPNIIYFCKLWNPDDGTLVRNFIPAKRLSDSVIGMYDTVSGTFFTNQGTGNFIAGPVAEIKIATTKMVDDEFAAAEANLAATVQTIESVVSRTITQTGQIATLQETKQTRPDENCPANMKCLLVQDEDGTPHWYPIIEP